MLWTAHSELFLTTGLTSTTIPGTQRREEKAEPRQPLSRRARQIAMEISARWLPRVAND